MSGNCELGRSLLETREKRQQSGAGRFEKPAPDARAVPPEAHKSFISQKTVAVVPLTGLFFPSSFPMKIAGGSGGPLRIVARVD